MKIDNLKQLIKGRWEMESDGAVLELAEEDRVSLSGEKHTKELGNFYLEEESGMFLLTIPSITEMSEVIDITPTSMVIKEFYPGAAQYRIRTFRRIPG